MKPFRSLEDVVRFFEVAVALNSSISNLKAYSLSLILFEVSEVYQLKGYRIFSNKQPWHLFNFEALSCSAYWRTTLKREGRLIWSKTNYSYEISKISHCLIQNNNNSYHEVMQPHMWEFSSLLFIYLFCFHFNLVTAIIMIGFLTGISFLCVLFVRGWDLFEARWLLEETQYFFFAF